ncbi:MAG: hypothetical protein D6689_07250, partial [Deltaproteobacteria bacterium]
VDQEGLVTFGFRGELSLSYLLGSRLQHELRVTPIALDLYMPAAADSGSIDAGAFHLDERGATYAFTIGYVARFHSVFGTQPLFTLE